jgi:hypothetical protein
MATGEAAAAAASPPELASFLAIGLDQRTAENALANRKVTANLTAVIAEVTAPPSRFGLAALRLGD